MCHNFADCPTSRDEDTREKGSRRAACATRDRDRPDESAGRNCRASLPIELVIHYGIGVVASKPTLAMEHDCKARWPELMIRSSSACSWLLSFRCSLSLLINFVSHGGPRHPLLSYTTQPGLHAGCGNRSALQLLASLPVSKKLRRLFNDLSDSIHIRAAFSSHLNSR